MAKDVAADSSFLGKGAQFAVMARLVMLGCHVAVPEPDYGTDVFVLREEREDTARLQVKSAEAHTTQIGFSAAFRIGKNQFERSDKPKLF